MKFKAIEDVNDAFTGAPISDADVAVACGCGCKYSASSFDAVKKGNASCCMGCGVKLSDETE